MITEADRELIAQALAIVPRRHWDGDAALVTAEGVIEQEPGARRLSAQQLMIRVVEILDDAAENWAIEKARENRS